MKRDPKHIHLSEFQDWFGDSIPHEAVNLVMNCPTGLSIPMLRKKLAAMGAAWKQRQEAFAAKALENTHD